MGPDMFNWASAPAQPPTALTGWNVLCRDTWVPAVALCFNAEGKTLVLAAEPRKPIIWLVSPQMRRVE